jgi:hypothetical protein
MAKNQRQINHMLQPINEVERLLSIASDFEVLTTVVEKDYFVKIKEYPKI